MSQRRPHDSHQSLPPSRSGCLLNMIQSSWLRKKKKTMGMRLKVIKDIESLDFDSHLIGILRHLVGLDILREQEVFYLPQPGEEVVRMTSPRKERSGVFSGADSSNYAGYSGSIRSPASMKAPTWQIRHLHHFLHFENAWTLRRTLVLSIIQIQNWILATEDLLI